MSHGILAFGRVPLPVGRAGFKAARNYLKSKPSLENAAYTVRYASKGYNPFWKTSPSYSRIVAVIGWLYQ
jgi:hypothetical protein